MARRKRVQVICHGPIAFGPHYKSPWEDVWLRWKGKPGRKRYFLGPTLECKAELLFDIDMDRRLAKENPEMNFYEDIAQHERALARLEAGQFACDEWGTGTPSVYTHANGIDRVEAERMLAFVLELRYGIKNPRFDWRRQKLCISPVGFGNYGS